MKRLFLLLAMGLMVVGLLLATNPIKTYALDENDCLSCHGNPDLTKSDDGNEPVSLYVSEEAVNTAAHRFIDCTTCHTSDPHKVAIPLSKLSLAEKCGSCQQYEYKLHFQSIHGQQLGGELGIAHDIHWLIGGNVWYLAFDDKRQEIGWVGIEGSKGEFTTEYFDPDRAAELIHTDPQRIENEKRLMDCMDCHTRVTHIFHSPEELIDTALVQGMIDSSLPFIKREGLKALDPPNPSLAQAITRVEAIRDFYSTSYPQIYVEKGRAIEAAIKELKDVPTVTTTLH